MPRKKSKKKTNDKKQKALGALLCLLSALMFISLITHTGWDDQIFNRSDNPFAVDYRNQGGAVGAISAYYYFFFLGWLSIIIPIVILLPAFKLLGFKWYKKLIPGLWISIIVSALITIITNVYKMSDLVLTNESAGANGGYLFYYLTKYFMKIFGKTGSVLLLCAGIIASLIWLGRSYPVVGKLFGIRFKINIGWLKTLWGKLTGAVASIFTREPSDDDDEEFEESYISDETVSPQEADKLQEYEDSVINDDYSNGGVVIEDSDQLAEGDSKPRKKLKIEKKSESSASSKNSGIGRVTQDYVFPGLDLLTDDPVSGPTVSEAELSQTANDLRETLKTFNVRIEGQIEIKPGPVITRFEFKPAAGIKVNQIVNLSDDLALSLKAKRIRIVAPIPGKAAVGIEIPNKIARIVYLKDIVSCEDFGNQKYELPLALGKTISGKPFVTDLARMPHLLVAGATNSGKSVCVNTMITSLIYRMHPQELKLILIDPKMLELSVYAGIPHLGRPVITNPKRAEKVLSDAVTEMQKRYEKLAKAGVRNIKDYNSGLDELTEKMPYIVIIVDELADMMMAAGSSQIEEKLTRLAQMARAVGIHLILATQRPSVDVITGLIKANFPARMAFHVASKTDSRTILDGNGAEKLLGNGDMLFLQPGQPETVRLHGALISGLETQAMVKFINDQLPEEEEVDETQETEKKDGLADIDLSDPLFLEAINTVISNKQGSVSLLQRKLGIGYQRAARLIDQLEEAGVVAEYGGSKAREVLVDESFIQKLMAARSLSDSN